MLAREGSTEAAGALFDRYWVLAWRSAAVRAADRGNRQALIPYVALLAILPLGFVLYRRNL